MVRKIGPNDGNNRPPSKPDKPQGNQGCKTPIGGKVLPPYRKPETPPSRPDGTAAGFVSPNPIKKGHIAAALVLVTLGVAAVKIHKKQKAKKENVNKEQ